MNDNNEINHIKYMLIKYLHSTQNWINKKKSNTKDQHNQIKNKFYQWKHSFLYNEQTNAHQISTKFCCCYQNVDFTLTRIRSLGFIIVPWKNFTFVNERLNNPSNSKSGGFLRLVFRLEQGENVCVFVCFFLYTSMKKKSRSMGIANGISRFIASKFEMYEDSLQLSILCPPIWIKLNPGDTLIDSSVFGKVEMFSIWSSIHVISMGMGRNEKKKKKKKASA